MLSSRLLRPDSPLGALARLPLRAVPRGAVVRVLSGPNRGLRWIVGSSTHGCWLGTYEPATRAVLERLAQRGMTVLDAGANAGYYTLALSRRIGPEGRVWAVEPAAENARNLLEHIALNSLGNVTVVQAALSTGTGIHGFALTESNSMGSLSGSDNRYLVPTTSIDELVSSAGMPVPDLVKMDIEGGESSALEGAKRTLAHGKTAIVLSLHGEEQKARCIAWLRGAGFQVLGLDGCELDRGEASELCALPEGRQF